MESTLACTSEDLGSTPTCGHNKPSYFIASFKLFLATVLIKVVILRDSLSQGHTARRRSGWAGVHHRYIYLFIFGLGSGSQELQESLPFPPAASSNPRSHQLPSDAQSADPSSLVSLPPEAPPLPLGPTSRAAPSPRACALLISRCQDEEAEVGAPVRLCPGLWRRRRLQP